MSFYSLYELQNKKVNFTKKKIILFFILKKKFYKRNLSFFQKKNYFTKNMYFNQIFVTQICLIFLRIRLIKTQFSQCSLNRFLVHKYNIILIFFSNINVWIWTQWYFTISRIPWRYRNLADPQCCRSEDMNYQIILSLAVSYHLLKNV